MKVQTCFVRHNIWKINKKQFRKELSIINCTHPAQQSVHFISPWNWIPNKIIRFDWQNNFPKYNSILTKSTKEFLMPKKMLHSAFLLFDWTNSNHKKRWKMTQQNGKKSWNTNFKKDFDWYWEKKLEVAIRKSFKN
jgi:hypothetical protein